MRRIDLVIIDGQNDFLDPSGALHFPGAEVEAERLASMIDRLGYNITSIHSTLDAHHLLDVAHPQMWIDENGDHPQAFTSISDTDILSGRWRCALTGYFNVENGITYQDNIARYVRNLSEIGRYRLCIWPPHCLIGSPGQNVYEPLFAAYQRWVCRTNRWINFVTKGEYPFSDQNSAIQADVPATNVSNTHVNAVFLSSLAKADVILWAGWAGSHALANSCRDTLDYFGIGRNWFAEKSMLLTDVCGPLSDVPGQTTFQDMREWFIKDMKHRGMELVTTREVLS